MPLRGTFSIFIVLHHGRHCNITISESYVRLSEDMFDHDSTLFYLLIHWYTSWCRVLQVVIDVALTHIDPTQMRYDIGVFRVPHPCWNVWSWKSGWFQSDSIQSKHVPYSTSNIIIDLQNGNGSVELFSWSHLPLKGKAANLLTYRISKHLLLGYRVYWCFWVRSVLIFPNSCYDRMFQVVSNHDIRLSQWAAGQIG